MMLAKLCNECALCSDGSCDGKTDDELNAQNQQLVPGVPGVKCGQYVFDDSQEDETVEPTDQELQEIESTVPTTVDKRPKEIPAICKELNGCEPTTKETPADRFKRISTKRVTRALYELKLLAQFGRLKVQYTRKDGSKILAYDWTQEQAKEIVTLLRANVDLVAKELGVE